MVKEKITTYKLLMHARAELGAEERVYHARRAARIATGEPSSSPDPSSEEEGMAVDLDTGFAAAGFDVVDVAVRGDGIHLLQTLRRMRNTSARYPRRWRSRGRGVVRGRALPSPCFKRTQRSWPRITRSSCRWTARARLERDRRERICCDFEFAELCKDIEGEMADEEEMEDAGGLASMSLTRPAANNDEAGSSSAGVINISSNKE